MLVDAQEKQSEIGENEYHRLNVLVLDELADAAALRLLEHSLNFWLDELRGGWIVLYRVSLLRLVSYTSG